MAYLVKDTSGEIAEGSISLPTCGAVPIGSPVVGVAIADLKAELADFYGERFEVVTAPKKAKPAPEPAPKTTRSTAKKDPE